MRALEKTANVISAAGCIMVVAFLSLLFSSTPTLNEIAFLLVVGVLIDCFVTTKVIIPCTMALIGRYNFWPSSQQAAALKTPPPSPASMEHRGAAAERLPFGSIQGAGIIVSR